MWWKQNKWKVLAPVLAAAVLAFAFWYGGDAPGLRGWTAEGTPASASPPAEPISTPRATPAMAVGPTPGPTAGPSGTRPPEATPTPSPAVTPTPDPTPAPAPEGSPAPTPGVEPEPGTGKAPYLTGPVPEGKPLPVEPQDAAMSDTAYTCTLSVRCDTILDHMDWLEPEKAELVPEDGVIFPATEVTFYEGDNVFLLLQREMRSNQIHMEFEDTPLYNSAYIEGIHNLYEFDCGELSGWMYKVNGWFPNYGCSRYLLQPGDNVEWVYTCDLGADVGNSYSTEGQP